MIYINIGEHVNYVFLVFQLRMEVGKEMDTRKNLEYLRLWLRFNVSERVSVAELQEKIGWITDAIRALALLDVMESVAE